MSRLQDRVTRVERTAGRVIDGKAVIVVIDSRELHTLNEVGTFVWELLGEASGASVSDVIEAVEAAYEVDRETAERDVLRFLETMSDLGTLRVEGGST